MAPLDVPACVPVSFSQASVSVDTITTTTGLRYIDGDPGRSFAVGWCQPVAVEYSAYLLVGTKFDSSDVGTPLVFTPGLGNLIDGLEQGVIGMHPDGTRRLIISPALGFGSQPRRNENGAIVVPGNSTVVFDVKIVSLTQ